MFELGERIIVLSGSSKSKTGARRGSIGYVIPNSGVVYLTNITPKIPIGLSSLGLIFVRYGFGAERIQTEMKTIINVFPILDKFSEGNIEKATREFIGSLRKHDFKRDRWEHIRTALGVRPKTDVCIVAPVSKQGSSLLNINDVNFGAWFESVMWTYLFVSGLQNMNKKTTEFEFDTTTRDYIIALKRCSSDEKYKKEIIELAKNNETIKMSLVRTVRCVIAISVPPSERTNKKVICENFSIGNYSSGPFPNQEHLYPMLVKNVFADHIFDYKCRMMHKCGIEHKTIKYCINKTKVILRKEALSLFNIKS